MDNEIEFLDVKVQYETEKEEKILVKKALEEAEDRNSREQRALENEVDAFREKLERKQAVCLELQHVKDRLLEETRWVVCTASWSDVTSGARGVGSIPVLVKLGAVLPEGLFSEVVGNSFIVLTYSNAVSDLIDDIFSLEIVFYAAAMTWRFSDTIWRNTASMMEVLIRRIFSTDPCLIMFQVFFVFG